MKRVALLATVAGAVAGLFATMAPFATTAFAADAPTWSGTSDGPIYLMDNGTARTITAGTQLDWDANNGLVATRIPITADADLADLDATRLPAPTHGEDTAMPFISPVGSERTRSAWTSFGDATSVDSNGLLLGAIWPAHIGYGAPAAIKAAGGTWSMGWAYLAEGVNPLSAAVTKAYYTTINVDAGTGTWKFATPVVAISTTTTLAADKASANPGDTVNLTATVTTADSSAAAGNVEFFDGTTSLGAATVSAGTATKAITIAAAGSHSYKATFTPTSSTYGASTSPAVTVAVAKVATTAALAVSATTVTAGANVTLTATVAPSTATGSVQFMDGTTALGTPVTVAGGTAVKTLAVAAGSHSFTAKFTGAGKYGDSASAAVSVSGVALKFTTTVKPTISGTAKVGKKLTAKVKAWSPTAAFTYQWYANGKSITGATKSSWKLAKSQKGKKITVKVTGSRANYAAVSLTSKATAKVK